MDESGRKIASLLSRFGLEASEVMQEFSKVPFAEPTYLQGFKSPYFNDTHVKLRQAARKFFCGETLEEALECEQKSTAPSKALLKALKSS